MSQTPTSIPPIIPPTTTPRPTSSFFTTASNSNSAKLGQYAPTIVPKRPALIPPSQGQPPPYPPRPSQPVMAHAYAPPQSPIPTFGLTQHHSHGGTHFTNPHSNQHFSAPDTGSTPSSGQFNMFGQPQHQIMRPTSPIGPTNQYSSPQNPSTAASFEIIPSPSIPAPSSHSSRDINSLQLASVSNTIPGTAQVTFSTPKLQLNSSSNIPATPTPITTSSSGFDLTPHQLGRFVNNMEISTPAKSRPPPPPTHPTMTVQPFSIAFPAPPLSPRGPQPLQVSPVVPAPIPGPALRSIPRPSSTISSSSNTQWPIPATTGMSLKGSAHHPHFDKSTGRMMSTIPATTSGSSSRHPVFQPNGMGTQRQQRSTVSGLGQQPLVGGQNSLSMFPLPTVHAHSALSLTSSQGSNCGAPYQGLGQQHGGTNLTNLHFGLGQNQNRNGAQNGAGNGTTLNTTGVAMNLMNSSATQSMLLGGASGNGSQHPGGLLEQNYNGGTFQFGQGTLGSGLVYHHPLQHFGLGSSLTDCDSHDEVDDFENQTTAATMFPNISGQMGHHIPNQSGLHMAYGSSVQNRSNPDSHNTQTTPTTFHNPSNNNSSFGAQNSAAIMLNQTMSGQFPIATTASNLPQAQTQTQTQTQSQTQSQSQTQTQSLNPSSSLATNPFSSAALPAYSASQSGQRQIPAPHHVVTMTMGVPSTGTHASLIPYQVPAGTTMLNPMGSTGFQNLINMNPTGSAQFNPNAHHVGSSSASVVSHNSNSLTNHLVQAQTVAQSIVSNTSAHLGPNQNAQLALAQTNSTIIGGPSQQRLHQTHSHHSSFQTQAQAQTQLSLQLPHASMAPTVVSIDKIPTSSTEIGSQLPIPLPLQLPHHSSHQPHPVHQTLPAIQNSQPLNDPRPNPLHIPVHPGPSMPPTITSVASYQPSQPQHSYHQFTQFQNLPMQSSSASFTGNGATTTVFSQTKSAKSSRKSVLVIPPTINANSRPSVYCDDLDSFETGVDPDQSNLSKPKPKSLPRQPKISVTASNTSLRRSARTAGMMDDYEENVPVPSALPSRLDYVYPPDQSFVPPTLTATASFGKVTVPVENPTAPLLGSLDLTNPKEVREMDEWHLTQHIDPVTDALISTLPYWLQPLYIQVQESQIGGPGANKKKKKGTSESTMEVLEESTIVVLNSPQFSTSVSMQLDIDDDININTPAAEDEEETDSTLYQLTDGRSISGPQFRALTEYLFNLEQTESQFDKHASLQQAAEIQTLEITHGQQFSLTSANTPSSAAVVLTKSSQKSTPSCSVCNKTFRDKYYLSRHMVVHSGFKPYCCSFCNLTFTQEGHLTRHIRLIHWEQIIFQCADCLYCFTHQGTQKHHKIFILSHRHRQTNGQFQILQPDGVIKLTVIGLGANVNLLPRFHTSSTKTKVTNMIQKQQQQQQNFLLSSTPDGSGRDDTDKEGDNEDSSTIIERSSASSHRPSIFFSPLVTTCIRNGRTINCPQCSIQSNTHQALLTFNNLVLQQRQLFFYFEAKALKALYPEQYESHTLTLAAAADINLGTDLSTMAVVDE